MRRTRRTYEKIARLACVGVFNPFFSPSTAPSERLLQFFFPLLPCLVQGKSGVVQALHGGSFVFPTHAHRWQSWCNRYLHAYTTIRSRCHFCLASSHSNRRKNAFYVVFLALPIGKHIWPKTTFSVCVSRTFFRRLQLCYHEEKKRPKSSRDIEDVALSLTNSKLVGFGIVFRFYFALLRAMFVCCFIVHYLAWWRRKNAK